MFRTGRCALVAFIVLSCSLRFIAADCESDEAPWSCTWLPCNHTCGGWQTNLCHACHVGHEFRLENGTRPCKLECLYGYNQTDGRCQCPPYRTGSCCEDCKEIDIPHCKAGKQECGGEPDGVRCTECDDGFAPAGYNNGCKECPQIDDCAKRNCSSADDVTCFECEKGYTLVDGGSKCEYLFQSQDAVCGQGAHPDCYIVFRVRKSWVTAKHICDARNGHLFVPRDMEEELYMENYLESEEVRFSDTVFWIGGKADNQGSNPRWEVYNRISFDRWAHGSHSEGTGPYCMGFDAGQSYQWQVFDCNRESYFICQEETPYSLLG